jgi:hypothetical protein
MSLWTDEQDAFVREHRGLLTSSQMAEAPVLKDKSRNAILGRVSRLGLPKLKVPNRQRRKHVRTRALQIVCLKPMPPPPEEKPSEKTSLDIPFMALADVHCRWITGRGKDGLSLSCGHHHAVDSSYCAWHSRIAFSGEK